MSKIHLSIKNASLAYRGQAVFSQINLELHAGKWISLLGPSGIGKSSLLRMIAGLTTQDETMQAEITCNQDQIAYMAQSDLLLPWMNVLKNTLLGISLRAHHRTHYQEAQKKATHLLTQLGLAKAIHLYPHQLSGGMRQRVALARTLLQDKPIILMDEPFSFLDAISRYHLQQLAAEQLKNKTVLFVTHDPMEALRLSHSIYIMQGQPATLTCVANLSTVTPRKMEDPDVLRLQPLLFDQLAQAAEVIT